MEVSAGEPGSRLGLGLGGWGACLGEGHEAAERSGGLYKRPRRDGPGARIARAAAAEPGSLRPPSHATPGPAPPPPPRLKA